MKKSQYQPFRTKLDTLCFKIIKKVNKYSSFDIETNGKYAKVIFFGLSQYMNGISPLLNFDILYLYSAIQTSQNPQIKARIHDPHITGTDGLSYGVWMGRQSSAEKWTHTYDVLILSTPHLFYTQNITKLAHLLNPNKDCLFLDLFGAFTSIYKIGDRIDVINFKEESKQAGMLSGMSPIKRLS